MTIAQYTDKVGLKKVARQLRTPHMTVYGWARYQSCPRPHQIEKLVKLTKGKITHRDIIRSYVNNKTK